MKFWRMLAVVTGVYFTILFTQSRAERLDVIAQLKAAQLEQVISDYYYQLYLLSTRDTIESALSAKRAGNVSYSVTNSATDTIFQLLQSSDYLNAAKLYDQDLNSVCTVANNETATNITSDDVLNQLFVLELNKTSLPNGLMDHGSYLYGPIQANGSSFISMTLPVYTNTSVLISTPSLGGYLSMIINIDSMQSITNSTSSSYYTGVEILKSNHALNNWTDIQSFSYVFDTQNYSRPDEAFPLDVYQPADDTWGWSQTTGHYTSVRKPDGQKVALGYSKLSLSYADWLVTVEQTRSKFMSPTIKLTKIMVGVCFGIALVLVILTFPLAHYGVRPIIDLQRATEEITRRRGLKN
ncbi:unnamed protein product [Ambrosiozyma monospora]|uniref:Unnamed protein product n=1 Tax=Ambrosiozyma monospora TaxID=43982 RepID=A0ACB5U1C9_AMBMO|nr:unnamed protein product [Ambrosiozyma monospora]